METEHQISKLDKSIKVVEFILDDWKRSADRRGAKIELTQADKIFIGKVADLSENIDVLIKTVKDDFWKNAGKIPPKALDLEEAVLGAMMLEKPAIDAVIGILLPDHFFNENHKMIFQAMSDLHKEGKPVDMRTVVQQLRQSGNLAKVGGAFGIAVLTSKVSTAANIEYHSRYIIEAAGKRALIKVCYDTFAAAFDDSSDFFDLKDNLENEVTRINTWIK